MKRLLTFIYGFVKEIDWYRWVHLIIAISLVIKGIDKLNTATK